MLTKKIHAARKFLTLITFLFKTTLRLAKNKFTGASRFFIHFFTDCDVQRLISRFTEDANTRQRLPFSFSKPTVL